MMLTALHFSRLIHIVRMLYAIKVSTREISWYLQNFWHCGDCKD